MSSVQFEPAATSMLAEKGAPPLRVDPSEQFNVQLTSSLWSPLLTVTSLSLSPSGSGDGEGDGEGDANSGNSALGPQSAQSVPYSQLAYSAPDPPSSQSPSFG